MKGKVHLILFLNSFLNSFICVSEQAQVLTFPDVRSKTLFREWFLPLLNFDPI